MGTASSWIVPFILSILGLAWWRLQLIGKRRFEIAEEALIAFMGAKDALAFVRNPGGHSGEGKTRKRAEHETPDVSAALDRYFVPIERLNAVSEKFAPLRKTQILCQYHLGREAGDAFESLFDSRHSVLLAAHLLAEDARRRRELSPEEREQSKEFYRDVYATGGENDRIAMRLEKAQQTLESICKPYLKFENVLWPWRGIK